MKWTFLVLLLTFPFIQLSKASKKPRLINYIGIVVTINSTSYECIKRLGKGEFGVTYLTNGTIPIVIKISRFNEAEELVLRKQFRFQDESNELKILKFIGDYRGEGKINGYSYSSQKYHEGNTLKQLIDSMEVKCTSMFTRMHQIIYDLLGNLHSQGLSHRDVHGSNMLFKINSTVIEVNPIDWGNSMMRNDAGMFGFMFSKTYDYLAADLMFLKAKILFFQKHKVSTFWLDRRDFCVE